MLKVVVFNAPPRAGKDHACQVLIDNINTEGTSLTAHHRSFKDELFRVTSNLLGISVVRFLVGYNDPCEFSKTGWLKDLPMYNIAGKMYSKREALIHTSENVIKPSFGKNAFGEISARNLPEEGIVFFSDSGFAEELQPIIDKVGDKNVLVVRIHRERCSFENDSREYLKEESFSKDVRIVDRDNNSDIRCFNLDMIKTVKEFINE